MLQIELPRKQNLDLSVLGLYRVVLLGVTTCGREWKKVELGWGLEVVCGWGCGGG